MTGPNMALTATPAAVVTSIDEQSGDIAMGVDQLFGSQRPGGPTEERQRRRGPGHDVRLCLR